MKIVLLFLTCLLLHSCAGNKIKKNDRVVASIIQTKASVKKIQVENQEFNISREIKTFMEELVTKIPYRNEYAGKTKKYLSKENVYQGDWEPILWFVENSDTLSVANGYHTSSSIYLVRQSLGEGFNHGLNQTYNVLGKVKVQLTYNYLTGVQEIKNGQATLTFLGFVSQVPLKLTQK